MSTPGPRRATRKEEPVRVDAALRHTVALLELVRQEEALLARLNDCVTRLRAVHRARRTLLDVTDAELAEAKQHAAGTQPPVVEATPDGKVGS